MTSPSDRPSDSTPPALVLADGGLEGLVAAAIAVERADLPTERHVHLWPVPPANEAVRETARAAAERQARVLRLGTVAARVPTTGTTEAERTSTLLLRAAFIAAELGCRRVVWPVRAPIDRATRKPDLEASATILDRALLVSRLVSLDLAHSPVPEVRIETPLLDLSDAQIADLALDLAVPLSAVWWATVEGSGTTADHARAERERWGALLEPASL